MQQGLKSVIEAMRRHGMDISVYDNAFLRVTVDKCRVQAGLWDMEEYCRLLMKNRAAADVLKKALQITYSCFFREPFSFAVMERLLPAMLDHRDAGREVRIWTAGCAGGARSVFRCDADGGDPLGPKRKNRMPDLCNRFFAGVPFSREGGDVPTGCA